MFSLNPENLGVNFSRSLAQALLPILLAAPLSAQSLGPFDLTQTTASGSKPVLQKKLSDSELQDKVKSFLQSAESGELLVISSDKSGSFDFQLNKRASKVKLVDRSIAAKFLIGSLLELPEDINACQINIGNIASGLKFWSEDHGGAVARDLDVLLSDYLPEIPLCPVEGASPYLFEQQGADLILTCPNNHPSATESLGPRWKNGTLTLVFDSGALSSGRGRSSQEATNSKAFGEDQTEDRMPSSTELLQGIENRHPAELKACKSFAK